MKNNTKILISFMLGIALSVGISAKAMLIGSRGVIEIPKAPQEVVVESVSVDLRPQEVSETPVQSMKVSKIDKTPITAEEARFRALEARISALEAKYK